MQHKHTDRQTKLLNALKHYDSQSVSFFDAKLKLLDQGYTEKEIAHATYSFSYDGIPNKPKKKDILHTYFAENPEAADKMARYIIDNHKQAHASRRAAFFLASRYAPGLQARSYYAYKLADEVDYPFFTTLFSVPVALAAVINLGLPMEFIWAGPGIVMVYWIIKRYVFHR